MPTRRASPPTGGSAAPPGAADRGRQRPPVRPADDGRPRRAEGAPKAERLRRANAILKDASVYFASELEERQGRGSARRVVACRPPSGTSAQRRYTQSLPSFTTRPHVIGRSGAT